MDNLHAFTAAYRDHALKGDLCPGRRPNEILCIHGAGKSDRTRYAELRSALQERGFGSVSFDCVGHGETGGLIEQSSLVGRTGQAEAVLRARALGNSLTVIGASMGAYNAIKLTRERRIDSLILIVPAVYTPDAYQVPFGPGFSAIIRQNRSWEKTDAWEHMGDFTGSLLVIAAENDDVIPFEIPQRLIASASSACWKKLRVVKGAGHAVLPSLFWNRSPLHEDIMDDVVSCIESRSGK